MEKIFRISSIVKENGHYSFFSGEKKVYSLICDEAICAISEIPPQAFSWQKPVLRLCSDECGGFDKAYLDGSLIADRWSEQTAMDKFIAHYPENQNLEAGINQLPILYRPGLKALLYLKLQKPEDQRYLSVLVWLNKMAATVYKRRNHTRLTMPAIVYNHEVEVSEIVEFGLKLKLEIDENTPYARLRAGEFLKQLGVKDFSLLQAEEVEVLSAFVAYMMQLNNKIAEDQNTIYKHALSVKIESASLQRGEDVYLPENRIVNYFLEKKMLVAYQFQDMLGTGALTQADMQALKDFFQI